MVEKSKQSKQGEKVQGKKIKKEKIRRQTAEGWKRAQDKKEHVKS